MKKKFTRRQFLRTALPAGAIGAAWLKTSLVRGADGSVKNYLPFVSNPEPTPTATPTPRITSTATPLPDVTPPGEKPRVVHMHHDSAVTGWSNSQPNYWDRANQDPITAMMEAGVCYLTGKSTGSEAWRTLLPNYQVGQGIAVKVNFNNTMGKECGVTPSAVNALPQVAVALITGLKSMGVAETDIWIYDGVDRSIPSYFYNMVLKASEGVRFYDYCHNKVTYNSQDPSAMVNFYPPSGPGLGSQKICDVLVRASYLINIPIMKSHSCAGISLGFKNHFGTIGNPGDVHRYAFYTTCSGGGHVSGYSPLVDIYNNDNIRKKTVLTIGDGIFGALGAENAVPTAWETFGNYVPQSLFFARDPVAIDSVMADFLRLERVYPAGSDEYLGLAHDVGLGVYEKGDPWGSGYKLIDYYHQNLS